MTNQIAPLSTDTSPNASPLSPSNGLGSAFLTQRANVAPAALAARRAALLDNISSSSDYDEVYEKLSVVKRNRLHKKLDTLQFNSAASSALTCLGPSRCPFFHMCPIGDGLDATGRASYESDALFPISKPCIVENTFIEQRLYHYMEEFNVDPNQLSELALLNDLITCDNYKNRALMILSIGDRQGEGRALSTVHDIFSDKGESSDPISSEMRDHPLLARIDKLDQKRIAILEQLNATRKAKLAVAKVVTEEKISNAMLDQLQRVKEVLAREVSATSPNKSTATTTIIELD